MIDLAAWGAVLSIILAAITCYVVYAYARKDSTLVVLITVGVSWWLCMCVCLLLPIDLVPDTHSAMSGIWNTMYWFSFVLMWFVIPLQQGYVVAGEFTLKTKLISSLRSNLKFYVITGVLFGAFLIYVAATRRLGGSEILGFAVCLSNTWGITLAVLLLGYGLVEVPRHLWHTGNRLMKLRYLQHKTAKLDQELTEVKDELKKTIKLIRAVDRMLTPSHHLREYLSIVEAKIPSNDEIEFGDGSVLSGDPAAGIGSGAVDSATELGAVEAGSVVRTTSVVVNSSAAGGGSSREPRRSTASKPKPSTSGGAASSSAFDVVPTEGDAKATDASLEGIVNLHYQLKENVMALQAMQSQMTEAVDHAFELEELIGQQKNTTPPPGSPAAVGVVNGLRWRYRVHWQPQFYRVLSVLCILLSIVLVWCELTMLFTQDLSPLSHLMNAATGNPAAIQFTGLLPLLYLQLCAMFSLFRLRVSQFYVMDLQHRTNENSLLYNASYALRCVTPLGLNFMYIIRASDTAFQEMIGQMEVIPFFGNSFNVYFPIIIAIFCALTFFNVYGRILRLLNIARFEYDESAEDDLVTEGKMLLRTERRRRGIKTDQTLL